jgi:hypothetical protein
VVATTDAEVIERVPLESAGVTGARLERVTLADGRVLVEKTVDPRIDWLMRATGDDGRILRLWTDGVLSRLPKGVDSAVEGVEELPGAWLVVMRDMTKTLVPAGRLLTQQESRRVVEAASRLHGAFAGDELPELCPLAVRFGFLTPSAVRRVDDHPLADMVIEGWGRFAELAPADVGAAVLRLLDAPDSLATALADHPHTLVHGDLKVSNIGFDGPTVVLLDWGTLTCAGPAALDHAWYLAVNSAAIDAPLDDLLADVERVLRPEDRPALSLALLGQVLVLGWEKALGATSDDPATRTRERAGLTWWCQRAADALEHWSPG